MNFTFLPCSSRLKFRLSTTRESRNSGQQTRELRQRQSCFLSHSNWDFVGCTQHLLNFDGVCCPKKMLNIFWFCSEKFCNVLMHRDDENFHSSLIVVSVVELWHERVSYCWRVEEKHETEEIWVFTWSRRASLSRVPSYHISFHLLLFCFLTRRRRSSQFIFFIYKFDDDKKLLWVFSWSRFQLSTICEMRKKCTQIETSERWRLRWSKVKRRQIIFIFLLLSFILCLFFVRSVANNNLQWRRRMAEKWRWGKKMRPRELKWKKFSFYIHEKLGTNYIPPRLH